MSHQRLNRFARSLCSFAMLRVALCVSFAACSGTDSDPKPTEPVSAITSIRVFVGMSTMQVGYISKAAATAFDIAGAEISGTAFEWTSSAPAVATVSSDGTVRALSAGTTTITATAAGKSSSAAVTVGGDVSVNIQTPTANAFFGDSVVLQLFVLSKFQIAGMSAKVGSLTTALDLSKFVGGGTGTREWKGTVRTPGLPSMSLPVSVVVTDINGVSSEATVVLKHDIPPAISIIAPIDPYQVWNGNVPLKVNCTDVEKIACVALDVFSGNEGNLIASGTTSIDAVVPAGTLPNYNNWIFRAKDAAGQFTRLNRVAPLVLNNPKLEVTTTVPGIALDIRGSRIAYADNGSERGVLRISTIGGGETTILDSTNVAFTYGYLTPGGVLFEQGRAGALSNEKQPRDFRGATIESLDSYAVTQAVGAFAIYFLRDLSRTLVLRDLTAGTSRAVATNVGTASVSANGRVAYYTLTDHQTYLDGVQISNKPGFWGLLPETDGTRVVYYRCAAPASPLQTTCPATTPTPAQIVLWTGSEEVVLTDLPLTLYSSEFRVVNGWIFYPKLDATGAMQLWSYSPSGTQKQISNLSVGARITAVGDNGEVLFTSGNDYYVSKPPYTSYSATGPLAPVGLLPGKLLWRDGLLYMLIGGTVFRIAY